MSNYPEVFTKGIPGHCHPILFTAEFNSHDSPPPNRPLRPSVRIKSPPSVESKEIQAFASYRRNSPKGMAEAETNTGSWGGKDGRLVKGMAKIPTPAPLTNSLLVRLGRGEDLSIDLVPDSHVPSKRPSSRSRKASPTVRSVILREAKVPSASFENEEIRGKVLRLEADCRLSIKSSQCPRKSAMKRPMTLVESINIVSSDLGLTKTEDHRSLQPPQPLLHVLRNNSTDLSTHKPAKDRSESPFPTLELRLPASAGGFKWFKQGCATLPPQFAMQNAYIQAMGYCVADGERKRDMIEIAAGLLQVTLDTAAGFRYSYQAETMDYYILTSGQPAPISKCCSAALIIQLSKATGGKVMCTAWQCYIRNLHNFLLSAGHRESLWKGVSAGEGEMRSKEISMQIQTGGHKSRSLRSEMRRRRGRKGSAGSSSRVSPDLSQPLSKDLVFTNDRLRHIRTQSQNSYPFDLKTSVTFQPPVPARGLAVSPIRRVLAKGGRRPGLTTSLVELETVWVSEGPPC